MAMVRVGVIGAGQMGAYHGRIISRMSDAKITGVCDVIEEKAVKLAAEFAAKPCTDFRDLLGDVDAVWVCTPPFTRTGIVTACAEARKDIFAEKPIALNLSEAGEMVDAAAKAKVKFMLGYVLRFTYPYTLLRNTLASGELGRLVTCWTRRHMHFLPRDLWYGRQDKSGGVMLDFGSHDVDWLRWVGGEPKIVFGKTDRSCRDIEADMQAQAVLVFEQGTGATDVCWSSPLMESSLGVVGSEGAMTVDRGGVVRKRMIGGEEIVLGTEGAMGIDPSGNVGRKVQGSDKVEALAVKGETIQEHFFRCLRENAEPMVTGRDGRAVLEIVLAIQKSSRTGKAVRLGR